MRVDMSNRVFTSISGGRRIIKDAVPVDRGYALLLYGDATEAFPEGRHEIIVLKKINKSSVIMVEPGHLVSIFEREES